MSRSEHAAVQRTKAREGRRETRGGARAEEHAAVVAAAHEVLEEAEEALEAECYDEPRYDWYDEPRYDRYEDPWYPANQYEPSSYELEARLREREVTLSPEEREAFDVLQHGWAGTFDELVETVQLL